MIHLDQAPARRRRPRRTRRARVTRRPRRFRKPRRPGRQLLPDRQETAYRRELIAIARRARALVREIVLPELKRIERLAGVRDDAVRTDAPPWVGILASLFDSVRNRMARELDPEFLERLAGNAAGEISDFNKAEMTRQLRRSVGVDIFLADPTLAATVAEFTTTNVALIKSIPAQYFGSVEKVIRTGFRKGRRAASIAPEIAQRFGVSERRARFIARDQVAKINGQLTEDRQTELGLTEYIWRTSQDERVREIHRELEGTTQKWSDPPVVSDGGRREHPGGDFQCLPRTALLESFFDVEKIFRRRYSGELTQLVTNDGHALSATGNHPVLTNRGWVPIDAVDLGDHLVCAVDERGQYVERHLDHAVLPQDLFAAFEALFAKESRSGSKVQFHGDGSNEQIDVVFIDGGLRLKVDLAEREKVAKLPLAWSDATALCPGPRAEPIVRKLFFADRHMGGLGQAAAFLWSRLLHSQPVGVATPPWLDSVASQMADHGCARYAELLRECFDGGAIHVPLAKDLVIDWLRIGRSPIMQPARPNADPAKLSAKTVAADPEIASNLGYRVCFQKASRVVQKSRREYSSHVYNLETLSEWYIADGIAVHNCRCTAEPKIPGVAAIKTSPRDVPRDPELVARLRARQRRRAR